MNKIFKRKPKGYPGEISGNDVFCPLLDEWIGTVVPCLEICDERGDYLNNNIEDKVIKSAKKFNNASKRAGFTFPQDIKNAINVCLFCQAICQDNENSINSIPPIDQINRDELLKKLYE